MKIKTKNFGELEINKEKVINFKEGLLGFEDMKQFILLASEEKSAFYWLQSVDNGELAFAIVNPFVFYPTYSPEIKDEHIEELGELNEDDLNVYTILVVPEDVKKMTTNLKAPIVINKKSKKAKQVIVENDEYKIRHKIYVDKKNMVK